MDSIGLAKMQQAAVSEEQRARVELAKKMVENAKRLEKEIYNEIARVAAIENNKPAGPTQLTLFGQCQMK